MNKILFWTIIIISIVLVMQPAFAESPLNIDSMSMDELVELEREIEASLLGEIIINKTEIPLGQYVVGEDIAEGRYVITAESEYNSPVVYVKVVADNNEIESYELSPNISCKVTLKSGQTLIIDTNHGYELHAIIHTMVGFMAKDL